MNKTKLQLFQVTQCLNNTFFPWRSPDLYIGDPSGSYTSLLSLTSLPQPAVRLKVKLGHGLSLSLGSAAVLLLIGSVDFSWW